jgi:hypothetical protein
MVLDLLPGPRIYLLADSIGSEAIQAMNARERLVGLEDVMGVDGNGALRPEAEL